MENPGRGGCKTQAGVGQEEDVGEKLMMVSRDNSSEVCSETEKEGC